MGAASKSNGGIACQMASKATRGHLVVFSLEEKLGWRIGEGLELDSVTPGSQADRHGLGKGWKVISVDGALIDRVDGLRTAIRSSRDDGKPDISIELLPPASPESSHFPKIFASLRFPNGKPLPAAVILKAKLAELGVELRIVEVELGGNITDHVQCEIDACDVFLVFGTQDYGEDTGNDACTYCEANYARAQGKRFLLLRMIPWGQRFYFPKANWLFGQNFLALEWLSGEDMPPELPGQIVQFVTAKPAALEVQDLTREQLLHSSKIMRLNKLSREPAGTAKHEAAIKALCGMIYRVHQIRVTSEQAESVLMLLDDLEGIPSSHSEAFKQLVEEVVCGSDQLKAMTGTCAEEQCNIPSQQDWQPLACNKQPLGHSNVNRSRLPMPKALNASRLTP